LEHGKGQNVTYDYPALEKNIIDRFIHGKPLIQLEIPQVTYRKDVYTAQVFANIRKNVSPQVKLTVRQQNEIVTELRSMQSLRECLDVIEIVIGFLSSGPTKSTTELKKYIKKVLKMDKKFTSKKAMEYCTLGHVLSLWETISVQMAKLLTIRGQEPFDSLDKGFHVELSEDQRKGLTDWLKGIELISPFLNVLYEFIETNVRHREQHEMEWTLVDTLVAHLDSYGLDEDMLPGGLDSFESSFPPDITIGQTVATWKAIVMYQRKHEQETRDYN
jgi:hypothetical protein